MGQTAVLELLEKNPNHWFTADEVATELGINQRNTLNLLRRLRRIGDVTYKEDLGRSKRIIYFYRHKGAL